MESAGYFASRPRALGLVAMGVGLALLSVNVALLMGTGSYKPMLFIAGCPISGMGLWTALTGIAPPRAGDPRPPLWWSIVFGAILVVGVCTGLYLAIHLGK
jgi:hypothetical protein